MSAATSPFARPSTRELQRQRTRARLFEAAMAEFARKGFDRASVAEIARSAGVSRPSFYFHFPSKEHVLLELQWHKELEVVERIEPCTTLRETLHELADAFIDVYDSIEGPGVARDMVLIYARWPQHLPLSEQPFPLLSLVQRRFVEGAHRGELRSGLKPEQATYLCLTGVFGYLTAIMSGSIDRKRDLRSMTSLYLADSSRS